MNPNEPGWIRENPLYKNNLFDNPVFHRSTDITTMLVKKIKKSGRSITDKCIHLFNLTYVCLSIALFLSFVGVKAHAQTTVQIVDSYEAQPLTGALVTLKIPGQKQQKVFYTDKEGYVNLSIHADFPEDSIHISVDYFGYNEWTGWVLNNQANVIQLDEKTYNLNQVVVTGQYVPQTADKAVQKIQVIDRNQIERMAAVNLRDVLTNQLQIRISEDLILGSSMRIQGISGENVKILMDGVPLIGRLDGDIDLRQINLHDIERIEIIEGPMSVNYGTNALAGTINLISKQVDGTSLQSDIYMESIGTFNSNISASHRINVHQFHFSGMRNFFNGWHPDQSFFPSLNRPVANISRFKPWKPREQLQGTWGYSTKWMGLNWKYRGSIFDEFILNRGLPRMPYQESAFDDEYHTLRVDHSISIEGFISDQWRLNVVAASNLFRREKYTYIKNLTNLERVLSSQPGDLDSTQFNQIMSRGSISRIHSKYKIELGYDFQREVNQGPRISEEVRSIEDYALFSTAEINLGTGLIIRPGFRWAYNTQYDAPLLPSLHVKSSLGNTTFRASYARGFRAPGLKELYFFFVDINHNIQGNPNLQAETSHNFTFNVQQNLTWLAPGVTVEGGMFYNAIQNMITLAQADQEFGLFTYFNIGTYSSTGGQVQVKYNDKRISLTAGMSTNGIRNSILQQDIRSPLLFNHEYNGQATYHIPSAGLDISLFFKHQGRLPSFIADSEGNVSEQFIGSFNMADITLTKYVFQKSLRISLGCKNLFNVRNVEANMTFGAHGSGANNLAVGMGRYLFLGMHYNII